MAATAKFLHEAFGWKCNELDKGHYTAVDTPSELCFMTVGIRQKEKNENAGCYPYVLVKSIDATIRAMNDAGSTTFTVKTLVEHFGWHSIQHIPGGISIGLWENHPDLMKMDHNSGNGNSNTTNNNGKKNSKKNEENTHGNANDLKDAAMDDKNGNTDDSDKVEKQVAKKAKTE